MAQKKHFTGDSKYKHPKWQLRRADILKRHNGTCQVCCDTETTLHVHHLYYVAKRELWEYPDWALTVLCEKCHENNHFPAPLARDEEKQSLEPWEQVVEFLSFGDALEFEWLWDLGVEMSKAKDRGITHHQMVTAMLYAVIELLPSKVEEPANV